MRFSFFSRRHHRLLGAELCFGLLASCGSMPPVAGPPPASTVTALGDGIAPFHVAGALGPRGGSLQLAPGAHPRLVVPEGALPPEGRTFALRAEGAERPPNADGAALSVAFEESPPIEARNGTTFELRLPLAALPTGCTETNLRLAVERPNNVGPGDGQGSPALRWDHTPARYEGGEVVARETRLHGHRLQFVCLAGAAR